MITNPTSDAFRRKILGFSELRLSPLFAADELERLTSFMLGLVDRCQFPPMRGNAADWQEISLACNLSTPLSGKQKRICQFGFDAIIRWINDSGSSPQSMNAPLDPNQPPSKIVQNHCLISSTILFHSKLPFHCSSNDLARRTITSIGRSSDQETISTTQLY